MSRASNLAKAIGADGTLNVSDVAGLAAVASSGSASDLSTGTLPIARIADGAVTAAKLASTAIADKLGFSPAFGTPAASAYDFNAFKTPGVYQYDGAFTGTKPPDNTYNYRVIEIGTSTRYTQIAFPFDSDRVFIRRHQDNGWQSWREIFTSGTIGSTASYGAQVLVVGGGGAGGGQGGTDGAGGGGAGGLVLRSFTFISGVPYPITVGAGGAGVSAGNQGNNGSDSSISTLVTAFGGGGGGIEGLNPNFGSRIGSPGGSGGGGGGYSGTGGWSMAGQGFDGAASFGPGDGGGGGAGAAGGRNGGVGLLLREFNGAGSASGWFAGGGGPSGDPRYNSGTPGSGGTGGGGAGGFATNGGAAAVSGSANTGGGGGGAAGASPSAANGARTSGAGGSGIVVIKYAGSQRGSGGTILTQHGFTFHIFNSSATYTA